MKAEGTVAMVEKAARVAQALARAALVVVPSIKSLPLSWPVAVVALSIKPASGLAKAV